MADRVARFRFTVDIDELLNKARSGEEVLVKLGNAGDASGTKIQQGMEKAGKGVMTAGEQSITAAVKFQTLTQGLLNLSTATAQTYTSISNLDRAQQRVTMSAIAHERAVNSLHLQELRLEKARNASIPDMDRIAILQDKIATQKDAIAAAAEQERLAQDQLNDTYILFGSSIANTVFSSIQTISSLRATLALKTLANAGANVVETGTYAQQTMVIGANTVAKGGNIVATGFMIPATFSLSAANAVLSTSFRGLTAAMMSNPLGLALIVGSIAALVAYEANLGGVKDYIDKLTGSFGTVTPEASGFNSKLTTGTGNLNSYGIALDGVNTKINTLKSTINDFSSKGPQGEMGFLEWLNAKITGSPTTGTVDLEPRLDSDLLRQNRFYGFGRGENRGSLLGVSAEDLRAQDNLIQKMNSDFDVMRQHHVSIGEASSHVLAKYRDEAEMIGLQNRLLEQQLNKHMQIADFKKKQKVTEKKEKPNRDATLEDVTIVDGIMRTFVSNQHKMLENTKRLLDGFKDEDERTVRAFSGMIRENQIILDTTWELAGILGLQAVSEKVKKMDYVGAKMLDEMIRRGNPSAESAYTAARLLPHTSLMGFNIARINHSTEGFTTNSDALTSFGLSMVGATNTIARIQRENQKAAQAAQALFNQKGVNRSSPNLGQGHRVGVSSTSGGRSGSRHSHTPSILKYINPMLAAYGNQDLVSGSEIEMIVRDASRSNRVGMIPVNWQQVAQANIEALLARRAEERFVSKYGVSTARAKEINSTLGIDMSEFTTKKSNELTFEEIDDRLLFKERYNAMSTGVAI